MNCKPGDLAVVVYCPPMRSAIGAVVECVSLHSKSVVCGDIYENVWELRWGDKNCRELTGYRNWGCPDAWLRPIRDSDGEDEMLRIAGKPQECEKQS